MSRARWILGTALILGLAAPTVMADPLANLRLVDDLFVPEIGGGWVMAEDGQGNWWWIRYRDIDGSGDLSDAREIISRSLIQPTGTTG